jgi:hypothetical protein
MTNTSLERPTGHDEVGPFHADDVRLDPSLPISPLARMEHRPAPYALDLDTVTVEELHDMDRHRESFFSGVGVMLLGMALVTNWVADGWSSAFNLAYLSVVGLQVLAPQVPALIHARRRGCSPALARQIAAASRRQRIALPREQGEGLLAHHHRATMERRMRRHEALAAIVEPERP